MDRLLTQWLRIREDERRRTALLFLLLFFTTSYIIVGRTARDALLLSRMGVARLPVVYVAVAVASSLAVVTYNRLLRRWAPAAVLRAALVLAVLVLLVLRYLIVVRWQGVYHTFYVLHEVAGSMLSVLFWTFANESFTTREAKRLFGVIGSGGVMAGTVFGFGGAYLVHRIGTANLLLVCVALLSAALGILWRMRSNTALPKQAPGAALTATEFRDYLPYARLVAGLAVSIAVAASFIDFEFKAVTQRYFQEEDLAAFFGIFYGACGLLSFFFHLFLTGRLLTRTGILPALLVLPTALTFGATTLLAGPAFGLVVYTKAADTTLRYSLNETCLQLLYFPLPIPVRRRLKSTVEGAVKPMAIGAAGLLFMYLGTDTEALTRLNRLLVVVLLLWIGLAPWLKRRYVAALLTGLSRRSVTDNEVPLALSDMASTQALVEALRSPDDRMVLEALELLPAQRQRNWDNHVIPLLRRSDPRVRKAAVDFCRREQVTVPASLLDELLVDPDDDVRAAAIEFLHDPVELRLHLADPAPGVRAKVAVALVRNSVDADAETALEVLDEMAESPDTEYRAWAAWAMGELSTGESRLRRLLRDRSITVQREALEAAGKAQSLGLIPLLVERLGDPQVGDDAAAALGAYGETALERLLDLFPLTDETPLFRHNVLVALRRIGTRKVVEALLQRLPTERPLRTEVLQTVSQIQRHRAGRPLRLDQVRAPFLVEIQDGYQWWGIAATLKDADERWSLFRTVVQEEANQAIERALLLLSLVYPVRALVALTGVLVPRREHDWSNAIELLDEMVDPAIRRLLMPLLDDLPLEERLHHGRELFPLVVQDKVAWCRYFLHTSDRWLVLCGLNTAGRSSNLRLSGEVRSKLSDADPAIRQEAACALARMFDDDRWSLVAEQVARDPNPDVQRVATIRNEGEATMFSSVDKVLFLRKVALFSQLSSRELLNVASIAEQVDYPESAVLLREGDEGDSLYLILSGEVAVQTGGRTVAILGPRECVGEMAILDREPRSATVVALDRVSALRIDREAFYEVMGQKREIALGIIKILVQRLREANVANA